MPTWAWIVIVVVAALIVIGAIAAWMQQKRRTELKERFGSEYDRTVSEEGDRRAAEKDLADRERKRERLDIVPLSPEAQSKYSESWRERPRSVRRRPGRRCERGRRPRHERHARPRLPDRRLRSAGRRHLRRPPRGRARTIALRMPSTSRRANDNGRREHRRPAAGLRPLPGALHGAARHQLRRKESAMTTEQQERQDEQRAGRAGAGADETRSGARAGSRRREGTRSRTARSEALFGRRRASGLPIEVGRGAARASSTSRARRCSKRTSSSPISIDQLTKRLRPDPLRARGAVEQGRGSLDGGPPRRAHPLPGVLQALLKI